MKLSGMLGKLQPHLGPPGPVKLEHRMKLSGPEIAAAACYDIQVDVPSPLQVSPLGNLTPPGSHPGITTNAVNPFSWKLDQTRFQGLGIRGSGVY